MTVDGVNGRSPDASLSLGSPGEKPETIEGAAREFESLLLSQLLRTMRESSSGSWLGCEGDESGAVLFEIAEQQFARVMAAQGGLGLAKLAASGLKQPFDATISEEASKTADKEVLDG